VYYFKNYTPKFSLHSDHPSYSLYFRLETSLENPLTQSRDVSLCTNNTWHLAKHVIDTYQ